MVICERRSSSSAFRLDLVGLYAYAKYSGRLRGGQGTPGPPHVRAGNDHDGGTPGQSGRHSAATMVPRVGVSVGLWRRIVGCIGFFRMPLPGGTDIQRSVVNVQAMSFIHLECARNMQLYGNFCRSQMQQLLPFTISHFCCGEKQDTSLSRLLAVLIPDFANQRHTAMLQSP
jgi:hypothetical protein